MESRTIPKKRNSRANQPQQQHACPIPFEDNPSPAKKPARSRMKTAAALDLLADLDDFDVSSLSEMNDSVLSNGQDRDETFHEIELDVEPVEDMPPPLAQPEGEDSFSDMPPPLASSTQEYEEDFDDTADEAEPVEDRPPPLAQPEDFDDTADEAELDVTQPEGEDSFSDMPLPLAESTPNTSLEHGASISSGASLLSDEDADSDDDQARKSLFLSKYENNCQRNLICKARYMQSLIHSPCLQLWLGQIGVMSITMRATLNTRKTTHLVGCGLKSILGQVTVPSLGHHKHRIIFPRPLLDLRRFSTCCLTSSCGTS